MPKIKKAVMPSVQDLCNEIENVYSDTIKLLKECGERATPRLIKACLNDHLGDRFYSDSWNNADHDAFDTLVSKAFKQCNL